MRDAQQSALYEWERKAIRPLDSSRVTTRQVGIVSSRASAKYVRVFRTTDTGVEYSAGLSPKYKWETIDAKLEPGVRIAPYYKPRVERRITDGGITMEQCEEFVRTVCTAYAITRPPRVVFGGKSWARAWGSHRITLPLWARSYSVLAHETAHILIDYFERSHAEVQSHGKEFAATFLDVLTLFRSDDYPDRDALYAGAILQGIKVERSDFPHPIGHALRTPATVALW